MHTRFTQRLRWALLGAGAAALVLVTTSALAGSGVGGVFNLGVVNTVDAQTTLSGNPGVNPELKVVNNGIAAAVRGEAQNGIGTNGISVSGVGQQGVSQSGTGTLGTHSNTTGGAAGVEGVTQSTAPSGAGVLGRNNGGGPALRAIVNVGAPPIAVNSNVKVANLNADLLDGLDSGGFWKLGGNAGTTPGTDFLGTTDSQALDLKVNGDRALRIEPASNMFFGYSPNIIGGLSVNGSAGGGVGETIAGGGASGAGGANANVVNNDFGTVGGGMGNTAGRFATVAGGAGNNGSLNYSVVGGGNSNQATAIDATVAGGSANTAAGMYGSVPGGLFNRAGGDYTFAAGRQAKAVHAGSFVWADSTGADLSTTATDQFLVRAGGGAKILKATSTFHSTGAALQVEHAGTDGEAAWLRTVSSSTFGDVLELVKHPDSLGNFLKCVAFDGTTPTEKCRILPSGTYVGGSDFAESLPVRDKAAYSPGDVLVMSTSHPGQVKRSHRRFDRALIGVYSTRPAVLGADKGGVTRVGKNEVPVAITGIVPVKVSAENGAIYPGDLLTSGSLPGRAMNAGRKPPIGTVLGKSLGVLERGHGVIKMLVMLR